MESKVNYTIIAFLFIGLIAFLIYYMKSGSSISLNSGNKSSYYNDSSKHSNTSVTLGDIGSNWGVGGNTSN